MGTHLPLASLTLVLPQEPGRIEYYNQLFCLCGHLGGVSEIQTSLDVSDFQIGHKRSRRIDLFSSVMHSYLFQLLDVLYRQVNYHFGQWGVPNFVMASSNHIVAVIQGAGNTMALAWDSELIYLSDLSYLRKQAISAGCQLSSAVWLAGLETRDIQGISLFKIVVRCAR